MGGVIKPKKNEMNTNIEIREIIKKNMPAQVGEELSKLLEQGKQDKKDLESAIKVIADLKAECKSNEKTIDKYIAFDNRNSELDKREADLKEERYNLSLKMLEGKLEAANEKTEFAKSVALGLIRNTEYRKNVFGSESQGGYQNGQNYISPAPISINNIETNQSL